MASRVKRLSSCTGALILLLVGSLAPVCVFAQQPIIPLQLSFSDPAARSIGFGGAFVALADDAAAAFANPAGLTQLLKPEASIEGRHWNYSTPYTVGGRAEGLPSGFGIDTTVGLRSATSEDSVAGLSFLSLAYPIGNWSLEMQTSKKVRLVRLIDEIEVLNDYDPRVNQKLRSLFMKSFPESLVAVVSGVEIEKRWEREGSPWYNFFEEIGVKPFGPQEAQELIERPIGGMFKLDGGGVERIISLTAGKPYLIQKICISLVTRLHEQHRRKITIADVEAVGRPVAEAV